MIRPRHIRSVYALRCSSSGITLSTRDEDPNYYILSICSPKYGSASRYTPRINNTSSIRTCIGFSIDIWISHIKCDSFSSFKFNDVSQEFTARVLHEKARKD